MVRQVLTVYYLRKQCVGHTRGTYSHRRRDFAATERALIQEAHREQRQTSTDEWTREIP